MSEVQKQVLELFPDLLLRSSDKSPLVLPAPNFDMLPSASTEDSTASTTAPTSAATNPPTRDHASTPNRTDEKPTNNLSAEQHPPKCGEMLSPPSAAEVASTTTTAASTTTNASAQSHLHYRLNPNARVFVPGSPSPSVPAPQPTSTRSASTLSPLGSAFSRPAPPALKPVQGDSVEDPSIPTDSNPVSAAPKNKLRREAAERLPADEAVIRASALAAEAAAEAEAEAEVEAEIEAIRPADFDHNFGLMVELPDSEVGHEHELPDWYEEFLVTGQVPPH